MKLSIIIPTYNEEKTIKELIRYVDSVHYPIDYEIIVVDDCSIDKTYEREILLKLKNLRGHIKLFRNDANRGKGASIRRGIDYAKGDIVIVQDADTEYDPHDIPSVIEPILMGQADVVYGSRFLMQPYPQGMSLPSFLANKILTFLTNLLYKTALSDMETCYKAMKRSVVQDLPLKANRFDFEPEITVLLTKRAIAIREVPIRYNGRSYGQGKKIRGKDFFSALWTLIKYKLFR
jgi:glycosyltransferase involved in cell wall biosynthesis